MGIKDILIWILSICLGILIWPIVFVCVVIAFELLLTIGIIVILAYYIKRGIDG
jgi:hypothetical protein